MNTVAHYKKKCNPKFTLLRNYITHTSLYSLWEEG